MSVFLKTFFHSILVSAVLTITACSAPKEIGFDGKGNDALALFSDPSTVNWGALYLGTKDGTHPVELSIASDGNVYRGIMTYQSSREVFVLEGPVITDPREVPGLVNPDEVAGEIVYSTADDGLTLQGFNGDIFVGKGNPAHLVLNEFYKGTLSGKTISVFTGDEIVMNYSADLAPVGAHFHFKKVNSLDDKNPLTGKEWTKAYEGLPGKSDTDARVIFAKTGDLTGLIFYNKKSGLRLSSDFNFRIDEKNRVLTAPLDDINQESVAKAICSFSPDWKNLTMEYQLINGLSETLKFEESVTLQQHSMNHMNFYSWGSMDVPFKKDDQLFNQLMNDMATEWMAKHTSLVDSVRNTGTNLYASNQRFKFRSYIWNTISYLSDDLVSVKLTRRSTHMSSDEVQINYNFKTRQVFNQNDVFREGSNYEEFLEEFFDQAILDLPYGQDPSFKEIMKDYPFRHMGISDNGLLFSTDFNGVFGSVEVIVPFEKVRPYLNADGPLNSFLN
ncbi:MAG: hypothetical protein AAF502_02645 [Bacteroidota bacterium]